jgi:hypothetical protein
MKGNLLSFPFIFFLESGLFNGLRPIQIKNNLFLFSHTIGTFNTHSGFFAMLIHRWENHSWYFRLSQANVYGSVFPLSARSRSVDPTPFKTEPFTESPQLASAAHDSRARRHAADVQPVSRLRDPGLDGTLSYFGRAQGRWHEEHERRRST